MFQGREMDQEIVRNEHGQFVAGRSPNPSGRGLSALALRQRALIIADLGGEDTLTGTERVLLDQAVALLQRSRRTKNSNDAVRCSNAATRIIFGLQARRKPKRSKPPLPSVDEMLAWMETR
jgi:hypothetical protein